MRKFKQKPRPTSGKWDYEVKTIAWWLPHHVLTLPVDRDRMIAGYLADGWKINGFSTTMDAEKICFSYLLVRETFIP